MNRKLLFICLMVGIVFASMSAVSAMDNENINSTSDIITDTQVNDIVLDSDSANLYSTQDLQDEASSPGFAAPDIVKYYKNGTNLDATLRDQNGQPIEGQTIKFVLKTSSSEVSYYMTTNENGVATLPIGLKPGTYAFSIVSDSDNVDSKVVVLPNVIGGDLTKYYNNGSQYCVALIDANGNPLANAQVEFTVKGKTYAKTTNSNGVATLAIGLSPGTYTIVAKNCVDNTQRVDTIKVLPNVIGGDLTKYYNNGSQYCVALIDANGNPLANAQVEFTVKGKTYPKTTNSNGVATLAIGLSPGTYTIVAKNCVDNTKRVDTINVIPTIISSDLTKHYKNGSSFSVVVVNKAGKPMANSKVEFTVKGKTYTATTNSKGVASLGIGLSPGKYAIVTTNLADKTSVSNTITVLPNVILLTGTTYYKNGGVYSVKLLGYNGKPLANSNVKFILNGKTYTKTTNSAGVASLSLGLKLGSYTMVTKNVADGSSISNTIKVLPNLMTSDLSKLYLDNQKHFKATLVDNLGNPVANADIKFTVSNKIYIKKTDKDGVATLLIGLNPGTYNIKTTNTINGESCSNTIKVTGNVKSQLTVLQNTIKENSNEYIKVKLTNYLNHEIIDMQVSMVIDGRSFTSVADSNGIASFKPDVGSGAYSATFVFLGNKYLFGSYKDSQVNILKGKLVNFEVPDDVLYQGDTFNVVVKDLNGKPLSNLNAYFTVNNVNYNVVTNADGVAKLKINLKPSNVLIYYTINEPGYSPIKESTDLKVISSNNAVFKSDVVDYGVGQTFKAQLLIGDIPFSNQEATIVVDGKEYNVITDGNGMASFKIDLNPGTYSVKCIYAGNSKIDGTSKTFTINVVNRMSTQLQYITSTSLYKEDQKNSSVKLIGSNGQPIAGQTVKFSLVTSSSKVNYYKTTDENGVATLPLGLNRGTYTIGYSFAGNSNLLSSSGSKKISITTKLYNRNSYYMIWMEDVNFANLKRLGTTDLFVSSYNIIAFGESKFLEWVREANNNGIYIHLWVSIYRSNSPFSSPVLANGQIDYSIINQVLAEAKYYSSLPDIDGITLDFVRFPGNAYKYSFATSLITNLVRDYSKIVRSYNPDLIFSSAIVGRGTNSIYYYGQDVVGMSKYVDVLVPLVYKSSISGNKNALMYTYTKYCYDRSSAPLWVSILGYRADALPIPIPLSELYSDSRIVISAGAVGISVFRWGCSRTANFGVVF